MLFSPLYHSKSVMEEDEMEDAPLLSLLAEGCEGSELAESGTVAPGLEPCAGCGLLMKLPSSLFLSWILETCCVLLVRDRFQLVLLIGIEVLCPIN